MAFTDKLLDATHAAAKTDRLLNAAEAANRLGLQPGTMYDLVAKGQIDFVKLFGKTLRFKESVIDKIIARSEVLSTHPATLPNGIKRNHNKKSVVTDATPSPRRRGRGSEEAVN